MRSSVSNALQESGKYQRAISMTLILISIAFTIATQIVPQISISKRVKLLEFETEQVKGVNNSPIRFSKRPETLFQSGYFVVQIEGQNTFISLPKADLTNPLKIIVYSHGSITSVAPNLNDTFMKQLIDYATFFSTRGYAFIASNEHAQAWGNELAVNDVKLSIERVLELSQALSQGEEDAQVTKASIATTNYEVYLLGYSMGGLTSMHYAWQYPQVLKAVALIAPTLRQNEWTKEKFTLLSEIPIKIWHGTKDVNIPVTNSQLFQQLAERNDKEIVLDLGNGDTHWTLENRINQDILEFYESSQLNQTFEN